MRKVVTPAPLGQHEELGRDLAHLADAAGRGREARRIDGLHRVHDQGRGLELVHVLEDALEARLRHEEEAGARDSQALAAHLDLLLRFLAGDVEDGAPLTAEEVRDLQQQRALADPGLAADEDHRAGHDPAPEHAVELADPGGDARRVRGVHEVVGLGLRARLREGGGRAALGRRRRHFLPLLDEAVPLAAVRTAAEPLAALEPARLAAEDGLELGG
jgi:hypothetical protein